MNLKRLASTCVLLLLSCPAVAQQPLADPPARPEFLSRYDFHLSAAALAHDDQRYSWDTHFGGEVDIVDYVVGRTTSVLDYQAVLGNEFRAFDPYQGNYILEIATSYRLQRTEVAAFFHHVSRHLSDRPKVFPVAWNILGVRVLRRTTFRNLLVDFKGELGGTTQRVNADYVWSGKADVIVRRALTPRFGVFVHGTGQLMGVDSATPTRGTQAGGVAEGGVRIGGEAGVAEFFAGFERRFDADPLDFTAQRWLMVGFRVLRY
ncbi:MAG TPA: hypothetical protein VM846_18920 [Vicinamibacterales bacterium]|nr:hypothetical protein [Vicinamibacterales bacterium]